MVHALPLGSRLDDLAERLGEVLRQIADVPASFLRAAKDALPRSTGNQLLHHRLRRLRADDGHQPSTPRVTSVSTSMSAQFPSRRNRCSAKTHRAIGSPYSTIVRPTATVRSPSHRYSIPITPAIG